MLKFRPDAGGCRTPSERRPVSESSPASPSAPPHSKPASVQELLKAWRVNGRRAKLLEDRLHQAVAVARRYRRDLLRLAEQNRTRKLQAEGLQQRLLELLENKAEPPVPVTLPELPEGDEQISAQHVRQLLSRLREAHGLISELETLLEFREKQVHELLSRPAAGQTGTGDWRVSTLQRELTEARHRIRLLTQELAQQPSAQGSQRVAELEQKVAQAGGALTQDVQAQVLERDQQIAQLREQLSVRVEELKKAVGSIHAARERIQRLEKELEEARTQPGPEAKELFDELTRLQDENSQLHEAAGHAQALHGENVQLRAYLASLGDVSRFPLLEARLAELEAENQQLRQAVADPTRMGKLEAAVADLRQKLQLAGAKYQEVKAALIDKHQQLQSLQNQKGDFPEPLVRTLEAALEESRRQNATLQQQLDEKVAGGGTGSDEALASMEAKLKEARRSAVRAQSEAGMKRKELAKLQEEVEQLKARLAQLGG